MILGLYCKMFWDQIYCWPYVKAGTTYEIPCPDYITGFLTSGKYVNEISLVEHEPF